MALANAVCGARHTPQLITWLRDDGTPENLVGATLTGKLTNDSSSIKTNIDGVLTLVTPASGIFQWVYGTNDVMTPGVYRVQFTATFADTTMDRTYITTWQVEEAL